MNRNLEKAQNTFVVFSQCFISMVMDKRVKAALQNHTGRIRVYFVFYDKFLLNVIMTFYIYIHIYIVYIYICIYTGEKKQS